MIEIILILLVVASVFAIIVARQPSDFRIARTIQITAQPSAVFNQVNNLRHWDSWSPWAKLDPNAKNSFEGPEFGLGAKMSWVGNSKVGEGSMTIVESRTDDFIRFRLEFLKPFKATNCAEFSFASDGNQTTVTWCMYGTNGFVGKAIGLVMNCEKMVGSQFDQGLNNLKATVETTMTAP